MPGRWGQFTWGQEQWAQADLDWLPTYPDFIRPTLRRRNPAIEGWYTTVGAGTPGIAAITVEMLSALYGTEYPDNVPEFSKTAYRDPSQFTIPPTALTLEIQNIGWVGEHPDNLPHRRRDLNEGGSPFVLENALAARPDATTPELSALWGENYPDTAPIRRRHVEQHSAYFGPVRSPGAIWTEPATAAITTTWTEPATSPTVEGAALQ